jgi:flagellar protein FliS
VNQSYAAQAQRNKYLETAVQTAAPGTLLIMLFDGAIRFCRTAAEAIKVSDVQEANRCIIRVQDIILEFVVSLDKSAPVADGLVQLYDYMYRRLIEANVKKDLAVLEEVTGLLVELKETWIQASKGGVQVSTSAAHG